MSGPVSASVRKPVPKRTGKRMWSRQYDGRTISAALMLRPVTFEIRRMLGAEKRVRAASRSISAITGSTRAGMEGVRDGEPARFYTLAAQPGAQIIDRAGRTGDDDLYRTVLCGNRDRQTASIDGIVDQSLRGKNGGHAYRSGGRDCMRRPRAETSCSASGSSRTPATVAATYSPIECPITTARLKSPRPPHLAQRVLDGEQRWLGEFRPIEHIPFA